MLEVKQKRYKELDSLRGLASFIVLLNHILNLISWHLFESPIIRFTPIGRIFTGSFAVIFFFVLSGFVISKAISSKQNFDYINYASKRLIRLYIPLSIAIIISAILFYLFGNYQIGTVEKSDWGFPLSVKLLLQHLLLYGVGYQSISLNPPIWSLIQEIRISLIFPFLLFFIKDKKALGFVTIIMIGLISTKIPSLLFNEEFGNMTSQSFISSILLNLYYSMFFSVGIVIHLYETKIKQFIAKINPKILIVGFLIAILYPPGAFPGYLFTNIGFAFISTYIIIFTISTNYISSFLLSPIPAWLGRISFSLYLIHLPVLLAIKYALSDKIGIYPVCGIGLIASLIAGQLFFQFIEKPSHKLSQKL